MSKNTAGDLKIRAVGGGFKPHYMASFVKGFWARGATPKEAVENARQWYETGRLDHITEGDFT